MINMVEDALNKKKEFKQFLLNRNPSNSFACKYITYLNGNVVRSTVQDVCSKQCIWEVTDMSDLMTIYIRIRTNKDNVRLHNIYSGVISAYIKFLQGKELRRRVIRE